MKIFNASYGTGAVSPRLIAFMRPIERFTRGYQYVAYRYDPITWGIQQ